MPRKSKSSRPVGQDIVDSHTNGAAGRDELQSAGPAGHATRATLSHSAADPAEHQSVGGEPGQDTGDIQSGKAGRATAQASPNDVLPTPPTDPVIAEIRAWHRERVFAMDMRKMIDLKLGAFLRTQLGWRRDLPEAERNKIAKQAAEMMESGEAGRHSTVVTATKAQREPFAAIEKACVKEMERLAETLPAWAAFGAEVRGFGPLSLAVIVAEAGDLSIYANPGKLWKRMGLAVMSGVRQGGLSKNASKEDWISHGYNRERRSRMWNIGDALIKGNRDGEYRTLYLERKEFERARDPEMTPIKAHRRAQRYMEKRLLRNLWRAWRAAKPLSETLYGAPTPNSPRRAQTRELPKHSMPAEFSEAAE